MAKKELLWSREKLEKIAYLRAESMVSRGWDISVAKFRTFGIPEKQKEEFIALLEKFYIQIKEERQKGME